MKILVTGSNGQLGRCLRDLEGSDPSLSFLFTDIEELDICNEKAVQDFVAREQPEAVVNCAAYTAVDKAEKEGAEAERINHLAAGYLATACRKSHARLIHLSTDYLFDGKKSTPYTETDIVKPTSVYGISKLGGETAVLRNDPGAILIRTSWLYSAYGNNFVKTMLRLGKEKSEVSVVSDQIGTPTYAGDLAEVIVRILSLTASAPSRFQPGIYHYSNEGVASWYDFAMAVFECSEMTAVNVRPIDTASYPTPVQRPSYSVLNKSKIKATFGLQIPHWRESLKKCLKKLSDHEKK
ncbi:MAG: dTDP-4-dehydrorhamnose reductase [Marinilabiliales bacterium]|nr:dTDP-4-dehydrorhamnose reductase [Marinilabiliales bacterium]